MKVGGELGGRVIAVVGFGLEAASDNRVERGRDRRVDQAWPGRRTPAFVGGAEQRLDDRGTAPGRIERAAARQGFVEHDAQAVDVGAAVDRIGPALGECPQVFRRHVIDGPAQRIGVGGGGAVEAGAPASSRARLKSSAAWACRRRSPGRWTA